METALIEIGKMMKQSADKLTESVTNLISKNAKKFARKG